MFAGSPHAGFFQFEEASCTWALSKGVFVMSEVVPPMIDFLKNTYFYAASSGF